MEGMNQHSEGDGIDVSARKKHRDCTECIAYCNILGGEEYKCGLGFEVSEEIEGGYGTWEVIVKPYNDGCRDVDLPQTKEEFVRTVASLGIEWDLDEVVDSKDTKRW